MSVPRRNGPPPPPPPARPQVVALLYYLMSYFPGGAQGVKFMLNMAYAAALRCFATTYSMVMKG